MSESGKLQCEHCMHENVTTSASKWCTDCEEGFCEECCRSHKAQTMSRNHNVISTEDYKKTETFNANLECPEHHKQFDFYCPTHDSLVCVVCVQSKHGGCEDIKPVNEAAEDANAFTDLEQTIDGLFENIENGIRHLQQNKTNLGEHEQVIKKSIATKRAKINGHLDLLEEKLLQELKTKSETAMKEISLMTSKLEIQRETTSDIKHGVQEMKQFSLNLQTWFGFRKAVLKEINGIKILVNSIPQLNITVQINPKFDRFIDACDSLGEIQITTTETVVPYVERRIIQAPHQRPAKPQVHKLDNLQLKLRTKIKMGENNSLVMSCLILPNKSIMIASYNKPSLTILNEDGSHDHDISLPSDPYDLTLIDDQMVAVSYGLRGPCKTCITILNINNQRTNKTLENLCKNFICAITYNDGKLYVMTCDEGMKVIDLDGNIINTITTYNDALGTSKVTIKEGKIYYPVFPASVQCSNMEFTEIWTCEDDRLTDPVIDVDNCGITFAASNINNLLLAISPDGKQRKVLLTSSDGLQDPTAVYYDKDNKRLLICNQENGHAALYDVIY